MCVRVRVAMAKWVILFSKAHVHSYDKYTNASFDPLYTMLTLVVLCYRYVSSLREKDDNVEKLRKYALYKKKYIYMYMYMYICLLISQ